MNELLVDLAAARIGGQVLAANDDFFAPKEHLVADADPVWDPDRYTDRGKWMDGWETRRRRQPGEDWALVRLGIPGIVRSVVVDTAFFTGNYPEACTLLAALLDRDPALEDPSPWTEVIPRTPLQGNTRVMLDLAQPTAASHLRFVIHPDGGVARLRVMGEPLPPAGLCDGSIADLAALANGARAVECSNRHYSSPNRMLVAGPAAGMWDGWETRRRRGPGNDWAIIRLGGRGTVERLEIDTTHFKGNAPGSAAVCAIDAPGVTAPDPADPGWRMILADTPLTPDTVHPFAVDPGAGPATHLRLDIHPDGGIARFRAWGRATEPWTSSR
jgi:allantoicase